MNCQSCGTLLPVGAECCPTCGEKTFFSDSGSRVSPYEPTMLPSTPSTSPQKSSLPPTQLASPSYGVPLQNPYQPPVSYMDTTPPPPPLLRTHIAGRTILRLLFYLWGALWFSLGLAAALINSNSNTSVGVGFVGGCVLSLIVLIILLRKRKRVKLSTPKRLLIEIGLTLAGFLVLIIAAALMFNLLGVNSPVTNLVLGTIFMIYGLLTAFIAFW